MSKNYVVCGTWQGKQVFYEIDRDSGYPFASSWRGRETTNLNEAVEWLQSCGPHSTHVTMENPKVCKVEYVPVDITAHLKTLDKLETYIKGLDATERKLLKGLL